MLDSRIKQIMNSKIDDVIAGSNEIAEITIRVKSMIKDEGEVAFGVALGRIHNAFHYQTRRVLKRNATEEEFDDFLKLLSNRSEEIKNALEEELGKR